MRRGRGSRFGRRRGNRKRRLHRRRRIAALRERIVVRDRAVGADADHLAQVCVEVLRQIARDRAMAQTLQQAARPGKTVVLLAGSGHVDPRLGVPRHLPAPRISPGP